MTRPFCTAYNVKTSRDDKLSFSTLDEIIGNREIKISLRSFHQVIRKSKRSS